MQPPSANHLFTFDTIGSRFWVEHLSGASIKPLVRREILDYVNQFDNDYSRFKPDSLIMQLAKSGELISPPVELLRMLDYSKELYYASEGAFNITVGATLSKLGYGDPKDAGTAITDPWEYIHYGKGKVAIPKGLVIDLGGLGKGWLIDGVAAILQRHGINNFIVNGGGDLYVQSPEPVEFALEDPYNEERVLQTVRIQCGALAGSNTRKRSWDTAVGRKHHIIDPASGDSSNSGIVASYVIADTALVADSLATIAILRPGLKDVLSKKYKAKMRLLPEQPVTTS